jgi:hypothetical protein
MILCQGTGAQERGDFSTLLRGDPSQVALLMPKSSTCNLEPIKVTLPIINADTTVSGDFWNPVSGHIFEGGPGSELLSNYSTLTCEIESAIDSKMLFANDMRQIFAIEIIFRREGCMLPSMGCNKESLREGSVDKELWQKSGESAVQVPGFGTALESQSVDQEYFARYGSYFDQEVTRSLLGRSECITEYGLLPISLGATDLGYVCRIDAMIEDGVWKSVSFFDLSEKGIIFSSSFGRIAATQWFVDIDLYERERLRNVNYFESLVTSERNAARENDVERTAEQKTLHRLLGIGSDP